MTSIFAPSDIARVPEGDTFLVGGRVLHFGEDSITVADALESCTLAGAPDGTISIGDLVVCAARRAAGGGFQLIRIQQRCEGLEPRASSEFSRLAMSGRGQLLRARADAMSSIRNFFEAQRFLEVETPTFVPCPGLDPHVHSLAPVKRGSRTDHLITSPEFHMKRLLTGGMPRVYQFARCFRAEELGRNHEPEFTLLEWYRAFASYESILADTEEIVQKVFARISKDGSYEVPDGERAHVDQDFARLTVRDAFRKFAECDDAVALADEHEAKYFELLVDKVEPGLSRMGVPVFLTHYPLSQAALARPCPKDETVAERFELYLGSVELSNGFGELTDAAEQRRRFEGELKRRKASAEPTYPLDEKFLAALVQGMPPAAGNALGIDRLIQVATGSTELSHTLAFSDSER